MRSLALVQRAHADTELPAYPGCNSGIARQVQRSLGRTARRSRTRCHGLKEVEDRAIERGWLFDVWEMAATIKYHELATRQRLRVILAPGERRYPVFAAPQEERRDGDPCKLGGRVRNPMVGEVPLNRVSVAGAEAIRQAGPDDSIGH